LFKICTFIFLELRGFIWKRKELLPDKNQNILSITIDQFLEHFKEYNKC
jgi:hypothetical protein